MKKYSSWPDARINYHIARLVGNRIVQTQHFSHVRIEMLDNQDNLVTGIDVPDGNSSPRYVFWEFGLWAKNINMALALCRNCEVRIFGKDVELIDHERNLTAFAQGNTARAISECWLLLQEHRWIISQSGAR